jgi:DNA-binding winged helix-turn-helix (wHTH) protein
MSYRIEPPACNVKSRSGWNSKDELVQVVWPDTAVSDCVLTVCLAELRKALGDTPQTPHYIETVSRRG